MRGEKILGTLACVAAVAAPSVGWAHPGHAEGFAAGLTHPLSGLDHALAALAAGWWATSVGRRHGWTGAAAFFGALLLGMAGGAAGWALIGQEFALAFAVMALGGLLAFRVRATPAVVVALLAAFAGVHGLAHGAEAAGAPALAGIAAGTAGLFAAGMGLALATRSQTALERLAGGAVALSGAIMMVAR